MSELAVNRLPVGEEPGAQKAGMGCRRLVGASERDTRSVLAQPSFLQRLCLERKRAERSRKPFLLVFLEAETLFQGPQKKRILPKIVAALSSSLREIDVHGWYKENSVIGVIFAEIAEDKDAACKAIMTKVIAALRERLESKQLQQVRLSCEIFPEDWDQEKPWKVSDSGVYPDLFRNSGERKLSRVVKRGIDFLGSLLALIILSPLFLVIAFAIKLTSKGPVLFRQGRVGQFGVRFTFLKFRSMKVASDDRIHKDYVKRFIAGGIHTAGSLDGRRTVYKITKDPRVTRVGRILRKTSLDELPQFLNVLRGEMSLVGPRPPVPYEVESYDLWHRRRVLEAKPGITGLWQISGRSRTSFDEMVRLDLHYARTWSLWLDAKILLQTPLAVFSGDGAY